MTASLQEGQFGLRGVGKEQQYLETIYGGDGRASGCVAEIVGGRQVDENSEGRQVDERRKRRRPVAAESAGLFGRGA